MKPKEKERLKMQDRRVCTYLVQTEFCFVHCSSRNHHFYQRGSFGSIVNFQINNGDNELLASIYRLFGLFLSLFWPPLSFSLNQKPFRVIQELHGRDMIGYRDNFLEFWVIFDGPRIFFLRINLSI
jgi:hypothetical protein